MNIKDLRNIRVVKPYQGEFAIFTTREGKDGVINREGEVLFPAEEYDFAQYLEKEGMFSFLTIEAESPAKYLLFDANTGLCFNKHILHYFDTNCVFEENGLYGFCDSNMETLVEPTYTALSVWGDSFFAQKDGKWGIIDRNGNEILSFVYDDVVREHTKDFANQNFRQVTRDGKNIKLRPFHFGYAKFEILTEEGHSRLGIINGRGDVVLPPEYIFLRRLDEHGRFQVLRSGEEMKEITLS